MTDWEMVQAYNEWVFESGEAASYQGFLAWKEQTERIDVAFEKYKGVTSAT